jgi:hypothetical protein
MQMQPAYESLATLRVYLGDYKKKCERYAE